jgi:uncharacterized protein (DUF58 family)
MILPSPRLVRLLAATAPLWLLALAVPGGWLAGAGALALLAALAAREAGAARRVPPPEVHRTFPPRFAHGETAEIGLVLRNPTDARLRIQLRDEVPEALEPLSALPPLDLPPNGEAACGYRVRARRRGTHTFGRLVVRVQQAPGLVWRELALPLPDRVKVYPRFRGVDDYDLLARIDQRDEVVRRPRRVAGPGTEFESLRLYRPGDDPRQIDWKATARRGALVARQRQVERGQQVAVLLDAGRLMAEAIDGFTRLDHAMNATIMLAHVARHRGDAMAVACFSNRIESFLPPLRGPNLVPRVLEALCNVEARPVESDYWQVTAEMMGRLRRRSLVVVLTEVLDPASSAGLLNNLRRAAARHLVLVVVLTDARLRDLARIEPGSSEALYRKAAACDLLRRRRIALEQMRATGIMILETDPSRLSVQLVRRYLEIRRANLQ